MLVGSIVLAAVMESKLVSCVTGGRGDAFEVGYSDLSFNSDPSIRCQIGKLPCKRYCMILRR